jgi:hypothetical protein
MATCDLSQIPNQVETAPRRPGRRDFLTIGADAAAVIAGITAPADAAADPLVALGKHRKTAYAEADRLVAIEDKLFVSDASKAECEAAHERTQAAWERVTEIDQQMIGLYRRRQRARRHKPRSFATSSASPNMSR